MADGYSLLFIVHPEIGYKWSYLSLPITGFLGPILARLGRFTRRDALHAFSSTGASLTWHAGGEAPTLCYWDCFEAEILKGKKLGKSKFRDITRKKTNMTIGNSPCFNRGCIFKGLFFPLSFVFGGVTREYLQNDKMTMFDELQVQQVDILLTLHLYIFSSQSLR